MKPPPCNYERPTSVDEALDALAAQGHEIKVLAGGQSLVPLMNMRLARPETLLDIQGLRELAQYRAEEGELVVGALTTQAELEQDPDFTARSPLLAEAIPYVGHTAIRNRGTVGGTIAHADPAAELPLVLAALGGSVKLRSRTGERTVAAADFFKGFLVTATEPEELLTEVRFPTTGRETGTAFEEFARRPGDFALVSVACQAQTRDAALVSARVALGGVATTPKLIDGLDALAGGSAQQAGDAVASLVAEAVEPPADIHGSTDYRRHLAGELARRAMRRAMNTPGGVESE